MKILLNIFFFFFVIVSFALAQPNWEPVIYTNNTVAYGIVTINGSPATENDIVGAFVNNECRAVGNIVIDQGTAYTTFQIQGESSETVYFKVYDASADLIIDLDYTTQTIPGGSIGSPPNFLPLAATTTSTTTLSVTPSNRDVNKDAGSTTFSIASNTNWSVRESVSWITNVSPASGSNNGTITVNYSANSTTIQRKATITVSGGKINREITITQKATNVIVQTIASVKIDNNNDFIPDNLGQTATISGIVLNKSFSTSSMSIFIQDETGGIQLFSHGNPGPSLNEGDKIIVTGVIDNYRGLNELLVTDPNNNITIIEHNKTISPKILSIDEYTKNAEYYEGTLIKITGVYLTQNSNPWPNTGMNATLTIWKGSGSELNIRIDKDTDIDDGPEPSWPVNITGIVSQYSSSDPPNNGYQLLPRYYSDFEQVSTQNISLTGIASAISEGIYLGNTSYAKYSVDGDKNTSWSSQWSMPAWLKIEFDKVYSIKQVGVWWGSHQHTFSIDLSLDGNSWMTVVGARSSNNVEGSAPVHEIFPITPMESKFIRINIQSTSAPSSHIFQATVGELEAYSYLTTRVDKIIKKIPVLFTLQQNYPNPFNPTTTIKYEIPKSSKVKIKVYNSLGKVVATLVDAYKSAGRYKVKFDGSQLTSGVYFYRLQAGLSFVKTKKLILIK